MIPFFPKQLSIQAILIYVGSLALVTIFFLPYAMQPLYLALGVVWVAGFFFFAHHLSVRWQGIPSRAYTTLLFGVALSLRFVCMTAMYFYFLFSTGIPFEFNTADALAYHLDAEWIASTSLKTGFEYIFRGNASVSDAGYYIYLAALYRIIGPNIYLARVVKCLLSAWTCILIYRMAARTFGEETGRMAGIFCCLAPNLLFYCGLHLKETEMIFIVVATLELVDRMIRSDKMTVWNFLLVILLTSSLFLFRTVIGLAVGFSALLTLFLGSPKLIANHRRFFLIILSIAAVAVLSGGILFSEVQHTWDNRMENQIVKREEQTSRGNLWAKYATGVVMAPMMFVIPFPTMVDVDQQYTQQMLSGGNYVRNFLGIFVLISLFEMIFVYRDWRKSIPCVAFMVSYLGVLSLSGFANSERFVLPALPFLLIFAADGVARLNESNYRWVKLWYCIVPLMAIGWAVFKLGSRGML